MIFQPCKVWSFEEYLYFHPVLLFMLYANDSPHKPSILIQQFCDSTTKWFSTALPKFCIGTNYTMSVKHVILKYSALEKKFEIRI